MEAFIRALFRPVRKPHLIIILQKERDMDRFSFHLESNPHWLRDVEVTGTDGSTKDGVYNVNIKGYCVCPSNNLFINVLEKVI
jgi:hypothetical protein